MGRTENVTLTNMCMVYDGDKILVQDRAKNDYSGICFPGGHVEKCESFHDSVIREIYEETGLTVREPKLCGIKQWQDKNGRYIVLLYKTDKFSGELRSSEEGKVMWIKRSELENYKTASDFMTFIKVFENDDISEFFYDQSKGGWDIKLLP